MRVTNIADACILFEHGGVRLLADPWIGTATYGFWLQYPPPVVAPEQIGRLDYIFISHLHEDHCDFATLARLDPDATILIMDRTPNLLLDHLRQFGILDERIVVVPARTEYVLGSGLTAEPLEPNPANEYSRLVDSSLLLHTAEGTVYFANDNEPYDGSSRYIADRYRVQLAMLPFYGGSGYPACYTNLTEDEKREEVTRIQTAYLGSMARCFDVVHPEKVAAIASWHCFGGAIAHLNPVMSWPQSFDQVVAFMNQLGTDAPALELFSPGQGIDLSSGERFGREFRSFRAEDRQRFAESQLAGVRPRWEAIPNAGSIRLGRLFEHACQAFHAKAQYQFEEGFRYVFDCGEGVHYVLNPGARTYDIAEDRGSHLLPYLKISMDRRLFALLLIGALSWNIEDAAASFRYERLPNVYRPEVYVALNFLKI